MVAIGGFRPVDGALFYTNHNHYEHTLLDIRSRMLESTNIRTRQTHQVTPRNYGNIEEEMFAERDSTVTTPNANGAYVDRDGAGPLNGGQYTQFQGTPLFLEQMFTNNVRYVGLVATGSTASVINIGTNSTDMFAQMHVGEEITINGETRTVTAFTNPTATTAGNISLSTPLSAIPPFGSMVTIKGRDYVNPNLNESYRVTDKYGANIVDANRYQVDRNHGLIRYRPDQGTLNANSVWHPQNFVNVPYYFGKMVPVKVPPPPAGTPADPVVGNEDLGNPTDPVLSGSGGGAIDPPTVLTNIPMLVAPDGQYSNIRVTTPPGVSFTVELNGAILAVNQAGGSTTIPFFDPNHENDQLKGNESIDPDIYIQRFVKKGDNVLVIKATRTTGTVATGVQVEGTFNGVNLTTGADAAIGKPAAYNSVHTLDWSASRNSILGIVGKVDFQLADRIAMEDINDEVQKMQGVLESLTTIIAGTDINQFQSILSVLR